MLHRLLSVYPLRISILILLLITALPLSAQQEDKKPNILVSGRGIAGDNLAATLNVTNRAISDVLQQSDLNAVVIEEEVSRQDLLETSEWLDAYFLVEYFYAADSEVFQIDLNAYSTWDGQQIASQSISDSVETRSDISWSDALDRIVRTIQAYLQFIEEEDLSTDQELATLSDREDEIAAVVAAEVSPGVTDTGSVEADPLPGAEGTEAADRAEATGFEHRIEVKPVFIEAFGSPFVAVGSTSDLFKLGFSAGLVGGYTLMFDGGELDLGFLVELTSFHAEGVLVSSDNQLLSFGPDVGVALGTGSRFRLLAGLSAGLTVSFIHVSNGNNATVYAPFLSGRLGGRYHFNDWFSLSLVSRFSAYFLPSAPVLGFQPSLGVAFRF